MIGAVIFRLMQDTLAAYTPQFWMFWIGLLLVIIVVVGRDRIGSWLEPIRLITERWGRWRPRKTGSVSPGTES
jgi:branched-chain amino acid transport system permease protein